MTRLAAEVEALACEMRRAHPRWGARRIAFEMQHQPRRRGRKPQLAALAQQPPSPSRPRVVFVFVPAVAETKNRAGLRRIELLDRAAVLENGRISLAGSGAELLQNTQVREAYLGA